MRRPLSAAQRGLLERWRHDLEALSRPTEYRYRKFFYTNLPEARKRNLKNSLYELVMDAGLVIGFAVGRIKGSVR